MSKKNKPLQPEDGQAVEQEIPAPEKTEQEAPEQAVQEENVQEQAAPEDSVQEQAAPPQGDPQADEIKRLKEAAAQQEDRLLRLAAEFDNFRKRSQKERDAVWTEAKASTAAAFLPVYDNLERALKQPTEDTAYAKGVEMTMNQLKEIFAKLDIQEIPALGEKFDPNLHNAMMHVEDESAGENTIVEVFQAGFRTGEKVIRFAMVKVAN